MGETLTRKVLQLCTLVTDMHGQAVPPDAYTSAVVVDQVKLGQAGTLALEIARDIVLAQAE